MNRASEKLYGSNLPGKVAGFETQPQSMPECLGVASWLVSVDLFAFLRLTATPHWGDGRLAHPRPFDPEFENQMVFPFFAGIL